MSACITDVMGFNKYHELLFVGKAFSPFSVYSFGGKLIVSMDYNTNHLFLADIVTFLEDKKDTVLDYISWPDGTYKEPETVFWVVSKIGHLMVHKSLDMVDISLNGSIVQTMRSKNDPPILAFP